MNLMGNNAAFSLLSPPAAPSPKQARTSTIGKPNKAAKQQIIHGDLHQLRETVHHHTYNGGGEQDRVMRKADLDGQRLPKRIQLDRYRERLLWKPEGLTKKKKERQILQHKLKRNQFVLPNEMSRRDRLRLNLVAIQKVLPPSQRNAPERAAAFLDKALRAQSLSAADPMANHINPSIPMLNLCKPNDSESMPAAVHDDKQAATQQRNKQDDARQTNALDAEQEWRRQVSAAQEKEYCRAALSRVGDHSNMYAGQGWSRPPNLGAWALPLVGSAWPIKRRHRPWAAIQRHRPPAGHGGQQSRA